MLNCNGNFKVRVTQLYTNDNLFFNIQILFVKKKKKKKNYSNLFIIF